MPEWTTILLVKKAKMGGSNENAIQIETYEP